MEDITHVRIHNTDMVRELSSKAVLSTNKQELITYNRSRARRLDEIKKQQSLEQRVASLESLVQQLVYELKHGNKSDSSS